MSYKKMFNYIIIFLLIFGLSPTVFQTISSNIKQGFIISYEIENTFETTKINFLLNDNISFNEEKSDKNYNIKSIEEEGKNIDNLEYITKRKYNYNFIFIYENNETNEEKTYELNIVNDKKLINNTIKKEEKMNLENNDVYANKNITSLSKFDYIENDTEVILTSYIGNDSNINIPQFFPEKPNKQVVIDIHVSGLDTIFFPPEINAVVNILGPVIGKDVRYLFKSVVSISGLENLDVSQATSMRSMFEEYRGTILDLNSFDVSKVKDIQWMFANSNLEYVYLEQWVTTNLTNMYCLFYACKKLKDVNFGGSFDVSKVTNASYIFNNCKNMLKIDLRNLRFNENCTFDYAFQHCGNTIIINDDERIISKTTNGIFPLQLTFNNENNYFKKVLYTTSEYEELIKVENIVKYGDNLINPVIEKWVSERNGESLDQINDVINVVGKTGINYIKKEIKYNVVFNGNGGLTDAGLDCYIEEYIPGSIQLETNRFKRIGYMFRGWNTNYENASNGKIEYYEKEIISLSGSITLYAVWSNKVHLVFQNDVYGGWVDWNIDGENPGYALSLGQVQSISTSSGSNPKRKNSWTTNKMIVKYSENPDGTGISFDVGDKIKIEDLSGIKPRERDGFVLIYPQYEDVGNDLKIIYESVEQGQSSNQYVVEHLENQENYVFLKDEEINEATNSTNWTKPGKKLTKFGIRFTNDTNHDYVDPMPIIKEYTVGSQVNLLELFSKYSTDMTNKKTIVLYPKWEVISLNIIYQNNNLSGWYSRTISSTENIIMPSLVDIKNGGIGWNRGSNWVDKPGYSFRSLTRYKDGTGYKINIGDVIDVIDISYTKPDSDGQYRFHPMYEPLITFDGNGASDGGMEQQLAYINQNTILNKNIFSRQGYMFIGWNTNQTSANNGKILYHDESSIIISEPMTLYAVWSNQIELVYEKDENNLVEWRIDNDNPGYTISLGQIKEINSDTNPMRIGNWDTNKILSKYTEFADGTGKEFLVGEKILPEDLTGIKPRKSDGKVVLYPQFIEIPNQIYISYESESFGISSINYQVELINDEEYKFLSEHEINEFKNTNRWSKEGKIITKYAIRMRNDQNHEISNPAPIIKEFYVNEIVSVEELFSYWSTDEVFFENNRYQLLRLYPIWENCNYQICFNSNGGTGEMTSQTIGYNTNVEIKLNIFTRPGYTFSGWKIDNQGEVYQDGQMVKNLTTENNGIINMYAQWELNIYIINFNGNGETSGMMERLEYNVEEKIQIPKNKFIKEGYIIDSWNTEYDGSGIKVNLNQIIDVNFIQHFNDDKNLVLYAQWRLMENEVISSEAEYAISIPMGINFNNVNLKVEDHIKIYGVNGYDLTDYNKLQIDVNITSKNNYNLIYCDNNEGITKDQSIGYQLSSNNKILTNYNNKLSQSLGVGISNVYNSINLLFNINTTILSNNFIENGRYEDLLIFNFTEVLNLKN